MTTLAVDLQLRAERDRRVAKAKALYPESWWRIRTTCRWAAHGFDLDDHAARVVLAAREGRS